MTLKNNMSIVPLTRAHVPRMAELERLCFGEDAWSEDTLYDELETPLSRYFICELDGIAQGYIGTRLVLDECYITNVAVAPDMRRLGLATILLSKLTDFAIAKGMSMMTLEVRTRNATARAFYEKHGFQAVGTRPGYYEHPPDDAILMTKSLL